MEINNNLETTNNMTEVVNVGVKNIRPQYLNLHQWILDKKSNVYIGRARVVFIDGTRYPFIDSIWANPYKISETQPREKVLELYREYIEKKINTEPNLIKELVKLEGKKLGCWCKPECCHGDILIELIEKYKNN